MLRMFWNKRICKNILWTFCGYPLKTFSRYFSFRPKVFFLSKSSISGFFVSNTYIFIHIKKQLGGGRIKALTDASAKNSSFYLTCSRSHQNFLLNFTKLVRNMKKITFIFCFAYYLTANSKFITFWPKNLLEQPLPWTT